MSTERAQPKAVTMGNGEAGDLDHCLTAALDENQAATTAFERSEAAASLASQPSESGSSLIESEIGIKGSALPVLSFDSSGLWQQLQTFDLGFLATGSRTGICTPRAPEAASPACYPPGAASPTQLLSFPNIIGKFSRSRDAVMPTGSDANTTVQSPATKTAEEFENELGRPLVSKDAVIGYMNESELGHFLLQHNLTAEKYSDGIAFSIGEGGREFLRAALLHYTNGRTLQGASIPQLLRHAHSFGLWPLVQRIRAERTTGKLTGLHLAFSNFKAAQSRRRRRTSTATMHAIRDANGRILSIIYDPSKTLPVGLQGRGKLKFLITKRMEENPDKATTLLAEHGLHGVRLRDATVAELLAVAWVLGLWRAVEEIAQANEEHKKSMSAQAGEGHKKNRHVREDLDRQFSDQGKKRCTQRQQSLDAGKTFVDHNAGLNDVATGAVPCNFVGITQPETCIQPSVTLPDCMESPLAGFSGIHKDAHAAHTVEESPGCQAAAANMSETIQSQPANEPSTETLGKPRCSQSSPTEDPLGHLEKIGKLFSAANPAAPNAKAVAAEIVKELLALVKKGLLPDPPSEVLSQLQSAAVRLGLHTTLIRSPEAFATASPPSGAVG